MKVLLVTTSYPLNAKSSSGIFVKRLKDALDNHCDVGVVCPDDTSLVDFTSNVDGSRVYRCRYGLKKCQTLAHQPGGIPAAIRRDGRYLLLVPFLLVSMQVTVLRRLFRYDVIFANWAINALIAWLPARLLRKPLVTTFRGEDVRNLNGRLQSFIIRLALRVSETVVLVSSDMETSLVKRFPQYQHKLRVIHNGVSERLLGGDIAADNQPDDTIRILTVASLIPRKDIATLLKAVSIIINQDNLDTGIKLDVVGGGELQSELQSQSQVLGIQNSVVFHGVLDPNEVEAMYAKSPIFVLPSLFEGRPNVVVEAMAAGCCVLATDIDGCNELITTEKNGILFPVGNSCMLADQLAKVIFDHAYRVKLGQAARDYVTQHQLSWDGSALCYLDMFRELTLRHE